MAKNKKPKATKTRLKVFEKSMKNFSKKELLEVIEFMREEMRLLESKRSFVRIGEYEFTPQQLGVKEGKWCGVTITFRRKEGKDFLNGFIVDGIKVYKRVLGDKEIKRLWKQNYFVGGSQ